MSYIGRGVDAISNVEKLDNITFNGGTTYALTKSSAAFTPVGANNILISIDGVIQQGNFSVSTTNIVFDWSPTSSNTNNFILHYGTGVLNVPADGSIVAAKMAANSVDSAAYVDGSIDAVHLSANSVDSDAYVDGSIDAVHMSANSIDSDSYVDLSIDTAHIGATQVTGAKLNTDVISAQTALAVAPADTDEFMVSDAGVLKRIDYSLIKGGGITEIDTWGIESNKTGNHFPITTSVVTMTNSNRYTRLGTGMNFSSGYFSFPSTGFWRVSFKQSFYITDGNNVYDYSTYGGVYITTTVNNSTYVSASYGGNASSINPAFTAGGNWYYYAYVDVVLDIADTANCKVRFDLENQNTTMVAIGNHTGGSLMQFVRLCDT